MTKSEGLAGIVAGASAIATVGQDGVGLTYRGYAIEDLAAHATFEEVAYLLNYGQLPTRVELTTYINKLIRLRGLPAELKTLLKAPLNQFEAGCLVLVNCFPFVSS